MFPDLKKLLRIETVLSLSLSPGPQFHPATAEKPGKSVSSPGIWICGAERTGFSEGEKKGKIIFLGNMT